MGSLRGSSRSSPRASEAGSPSLNGNRAMNDQKQGDPLPFERRPAGYLAAVAVVGVTTALSALVFGRSFLVEVGMVYLLGIVIVALRVGFGPSLLAAVLSMLGF